MESRASRGQPLVAPPAGAWIETGTVRPKIEAPIVAPPAGAWIETATPARRGLESYVAPPAGAWIETIAILMMVSLSLSRLPQARGLKLA